MLSQEVAEELSQSDASDQKSDLNNRDKWPMIYELQPLPLISTIPRLYVRQFGPQILSFFRVVTVHCNAIVILSKECSQNCFSTLKELEMMKVSAKANLHSKYFLLLLQKAGPAGLRIVFMSNSEAKLEGTTVGELLALFRALEVHNRMNFHIVAGLPPCTDKRLLFAGTAPSSLLF